MYSLLSDIGSIFTEPVTLYLNSYEHSAIVVAILLGVIGAFAPCQLTGNISAITLYGSRTIRMDNNWGEIISFILGKVVVYSFIGLFAWIFGQTFQTKMTEYFPIFRKAMGPLMIVTGLVLLGILKFKFLNKFNFDIPTRLKEGKIGSFLLGSSFAIAFCPTMFVLFFVWLMPTVISSSYGLVLPAIFGIATSIPLIIILVLIWIFNVKGYIMKKSVKIGRTIQQFAGIILIIVGIFDMITYW
ncbi:MAG: sulfite exporter TauE/SafE family protein [Lysinibacillus sp.]|nr:sulfite exporter TauE/SafE family protein [Lysinibacillus sp.]